MTIFMIVFRHELRRAVRDRAMTSMVLLFALLSAYAAWHGSQRVSDRDNALRGIALQEAHGRDAYLDRMMEGQRINPTLRIGIGALAGGLWYQPTLPVGPLAALSSGQADKYPYDAKLHARSDPNGLFAGLGVDTANPVEIAAGPFDLAFVIVFALPLVLLAATYDLWSHERDLGTSGFLLSQPVGFTTLLLAKATARGGVMLAVLTGILFVSLLGVSGVGRDSVAGTLALILVVVPYGLFWIGLACLLDVLVRSSTQAAIASGAAWVGLVLLLPALLSALHETARPAPDRAQYVNMLRLPEHDIDARERTRLINVYHGQDRRRRDFADSLRLFAPSVAVQDALDRIAGTDADRAMDFQRQVVNFSAELRGLAMERRTDGQTSAVAELVHLLPRFTYREPAAATRRKPLWADMGILFACTAVVVLVLLLRMRARMASENEEAGAG